jgi:hypothetical protein
VICSYLSAKIANAIKTDATHSIEVPLPKRNKKMCFGRMRIELPAFGHGARGLWPWLATHEEA